MASSAQQMSRDELLEFVRRLPDKTPIATTLAPDHSAKKSWINWLSNYADHGDHPLRAQRDARFIYNHWWNVPIFIWLAEASGVDQKADANTAATLIAVAARMAAILSHSFAALWRAGAYAHKTGYRVQGFSAEDISEDHHIYEPVTCPACRQVHHVNPRTGAILGVKRE
jgi:hypothetical protein